MVDIELALHTESFVRLSFPYEELVKSTYTWGNKCVSRFGALGGNVIMERVAGSFSGRLRQDRGPTTQQRRRGQRARWTLWQRAADRFYSGNKQTRGGCHALARARSGREGSSGIVKERVCFGLDLFGLGQQSM